MATSFTMTVLRDVAPIVWYSPTFQSLLCPSITLAMEAMSHSQTSVKKSSRLHYETYRHIGEYPVSGPRFETKLNDYDGMRLCLRTAAMNGPIHPPGDL
jgi:hypothetical protein